MSETKKQASFFTILLPILFLSLLIVYGLILRPVWLSKNAIPLEMIFLLAASFTIGQLLWMKIPWQTIMDSVASKLAKAFPAILILFCIGLIIGSWIVSGTIPMLIYYGIKWIHPDYLYILAFIIPVVFSMLTGTSWGAIGTIGVVLLGVATTQGGDLGITAGAIVGGAYFGDKLSPLSDTTNLAAMAVEVDLYEHIRSMLYTTLPSAIIAAVIFFIMGWVYPPTLQSGDDPLVRHTLLNIGSLFKFHWTLLFPPLLVLVGSLRRWPTLPTLISSSLLAAILALIIQSFSFDDVVSTLLHGFKLEMAVGAENMPEQIYTLFERGGLYALIDAIVFALMVFVFIGALDVMDAMPRIVHRVFGFANTRVKTILSSLLATGFTNALTSNQYATSFIIGDAFKHKYDEMKIDRRVLSRSLEDYGTMIESVVPWTATSLFVVSSLGIAYSSYAPWQLLSLINLVIAPLMAVLGIGQFKKN